MNDGGPAGGVLFVPGRAGSIVLAVVTDVLLTVGLLAVARALLGAARRAVHRGARPAQAW